MSFKNIPRLYINKDLICNSLIELESRNIHYLKNVLRLKKKQVIRVFNGKDGEWEAEILSSECNSLKCSKLIKPQIFSDGPSIYFALIKGNNLKWLLEKSTELGVANLYPILTNRGNVRNFNYKRAKLNILEASEVSERLDLPILHELRTFEKMLIELQKKKEPVVFCNESRNDIHISEFLEKENSKNISFIIGPEGGFSDNELKVVENIPNITSVKIHDRILKAETAVIFVMSIYNHFMQLKT